MQLLKISLSCLVLLACIEASCQDTTTNSIYFLSGPNYSFYRGNDLVQDLFKPSVTYTHGLGYKRRFDRGVSSRVQVQQLIQGMQDKITWTDETGSTISESPILFRMEYVVLSAMLEKSFGTKQIFKVFGGGYGAYNYRSFSLIQSEVIFFGSYTDFTSKTEKMDFGLAAGFGFSYPLAKALRLNLDFTNFFGLTNSLNVQDIVRKLNSTNAMLGFEFRF